MSSVVTRTTSPTTQDKPNHIQHGLTTGIARRSSEPRINNAAKEEAAEMTRSQLLLQASAAVFTQTTHLTVSALTLLG